MFRGWPSDAEAMVWRDVDERAEWRSAYGPFVPVLMLGDEVVCQLQPDLDRIRQYFGETANPV